MFGGFNMQVESDLPVGAGLSSSAALEVATARLLMKLYSLEIDPLRLAKICRRAENDFVGVKSGLLDQVSSIFGRRGQAVYLDCRTERDRQHPATARLARCWCFIAGWSTGWSAASTTSAASSVSLRRRAMGVPALRDVSSAHSWKPPRATGSTR